MMELYTMVRLFDWEGHLIFFIAKSALWLSQPGFPVPAIIVSPILFGCEVLSLSEAEPTKQIRYINRELSPLFVLAKFHWKKKEIKI
jgi:hypothetical protein